MKPLLIYCYDAYCGWCYGFSPVIKKVAEEYAEVMDNTVLSGGMILPGKPVHIEKTAGYILEAYQHVQSTTGIVFGEDYLWHLRNPDKSDWYPHSEKPAIAMCVFKSYFPKLAVEFASDLQYALHFEGRDLTDDEAYRHLLEKYDIPAEEFYLKLHHESFREDAYYEFSLVKQLKVNGYPSVFVQTSDSHFFMAARGYSSYEELKPRIEKILEDTKAHS